MLWHTVAAWFQENRIENFSKCEPEGAHGITQKRMRRILVLLVSVAIGVAVLATLDLSRT
jgi:hypothetical protein